MESHDCLKASIGESGDASVRIYDRNLKLHDQGQGPRAQDYNTTLKLRSTLN